MVVLFLSKRNDLIMHIEDTQLCIDTWTYACGIRITVAPFIPRNSIKGRSYNLYWSPVMRGFLYLSVSSPKLFAPIHDFVFFIFLYSSENRVFY